MTRNILARSAFRTKIAKCLLSAAQKQDVCLVQHVTMAKSRPQTTVTTTLSACPDVAVVTRAVTSGCAYLAARSTRTATPNAAPSITAQHHLCAEAAKLTKTPVTLMKNAKANSAQMINAQPHNLFLPQQAWPSQLL